VRFSHVSAPGRTARALALAAFLSLVGAEVAHGQALLVLLFGDKLSTETLQVGINADVGWTGQSGLLDSGTRFNWAFGAYAEIKLSDSWRLQPELTLKTPAGAEGLFAGEAGNPFEPTGNEDIDEVIETGRVERSLNYISIPVFAKYMVGPLGIGAGGYVAFLTGATDELTSDVDQGLVRLNDSAKDALNTVDAGLIFNLDYSLKPEAAMRSIKINGKLYYGLTDTVTDNPGDAVKNWMLFVGLDIPVGGKNAVEDADD
jgi:hypothetical protein